MLSCSNTSEPIKTTTQLQNPLMPLTVGNWWKYQKKFDSDTNEFTVWRVTNVERANSSVTATITHHTYRKGKEQDTLTSGTFLVTENDTILRSGNLYDGTLRSINKVGIYDHSNINNTISSAGLYRIYPATYRMVVAAGTFDNILIFAYFNAYGSPVVHGEEQYIKPGVGSISTLIDRTRYELVEYSLISNN